MSEKQAEKGQTDYNRRDFIKGATSFSSMMLLMGGIPLEAKAEDKAPDAQPKETGFSTDDRPVTSAVIGRGARGKEILQTLAVYTHSKTKQPLAPVAAICDIYKPYHEQGTKTSHRRRRRSRITRSCWRTSRWRR